MRLVLDARTAAFATLIDYAGLFPPASLSVEDAVGEYRRIRAGASAWVGGRFLCRASQLADLASVATRTFAAGETPWEVSVIFDGTPGESAALAKDFHAEMDPVMVVAAAEARLGGAANVAVDPLIDSMLSIAPEVVPFIEVDRSRSIKEQVDSVATTLESRRRVGGVKLRCGGEAVDSFPTPGEVAEFIAASVDARMPFKATAGLHQPIRHFDDNLGLERHGFVNLLIATALAEAGEDRATIEHVIAETDPDAFAMSAAFASWRDRKVPGSALRRMRHSGFVAYGSCDFNEPTEALIELGFMGQGE